MNRVPLKHKLEVTFLWREQYAIPVHNEQLLVWSDQYIGRVDVGMAEDESQIHLLEAPSDRICSLEKSFDDVILFFPNARQLFLMGIRKFLLINPLMQLSGERAPARKKSFAT